MIKGNSGRINKIKAAQERNDAERFKDFEKQTQSLVDEDIKEHVAQIEKREKEEKEREDDALAIKKELQIEALSSDKSAVSENPTLAVIASQDNSQTVLTEDEIKKMVEAYRKSSDKYVKIKVFAEIYRIEEGEVVRLLQIGGITDEELPKKRGRKKKYEETYERVGFNLSTSTYNVMLKKIKENGETITTYLKRLVLEDLQK